MSVSFTHEVADGMHGAIVKAVKPLDAVTRVPLLPARAGCR